MTLQLYTGRTGMATYRRAVAYWEGIHRPERRRVDWSRQEHGHWRGALEPLTVCLRATRKRKGPGAFSRADRRRHRSGLHLMRQIIASHARTPQLGLLLDSAAYG